MDDELEVRQARHHEATRFERSVRGICNECVQPWPCDAAAVFTALGRAERRNQINMDAYANVTQQMVEQRQARQEAERLLQRNLDAIEGERARWRELDGHRLRQMEKAETEIARLREDLERTLRVMGHTGNALVAAELQRDNWQQSAREFCGNAEYWRERTHTAEARDRDARDLIQHLRQSLLAANQRADTEHARAERLATALEQITQRIDGLTPDEVDDAAYVMADIARQALAEE